MYALLALTGREGTTVLVLCLCLEWELACYKDVMHGRVATYLESRLQELN